MTLTWQGSRGARLLARITPIAILALAALLRFWALDRPDSLVFDELYYVRDAVSQLVHGYPTVWPDDEPAFSGERPHEFTDMASTIAHPPLGKWLIALGLLLFGTDTGWGWRCAVAFAGVATVGITMRLGFLLSRSVWVAWIAGFVLAVDGVHIVLSRVALLDGFLTLLIVLGALFMLLDWQRAHSLWRRPWLVAAGLTFGAAAAVKWSGLYPLAAFVLLGIFGDLLRRLGKDQPPAVPHQRTRAELARGFAHAFATGVVVLPAALLSYLASWTGWIITTGGQGREPGVPWWVSLWKWHTEAFAWHSTLTAPHPYQSHPLGWPLALRPTAMFSERLDGQIAVISPLPNPLVTWGGVAALGLLLGVVVRACTQAVRSRTLTPLGGVTVFASAFVLTGVLSGWLPWLFTLSRSAVFQFYAVVMTPFAALALALVLASFASLSATPPGPAGSGRSPGLLEAAGMRLGRSPDAVRGRQSAVVIFLGTALLLALLFWPLWAAMPVADWFYRWHLWLPGWG